MKSEAVQIHFLGDVFAIGLLSSKILLPWQCDVTTSPPYLSGQSWILDFTQWNPDSRYWTRDSLHLPVELSWITDSKTQDSEFPKKIVPGIPEYGLTHFALHGAI